MFFLETSQKEGMVIPSKNECNPHSIPSDMPNDYTLLNQKQERERERRCHFKEKMSLEEAHHHRRPWIRAWRKKEMNEGRGREEHEILCSYLIDQSFLVKSIVFSKIFFNSLFDTYACPLVWG